VFASGFSSTTWLADNLAGFEPVLASTLAVVAGIGLVSGMRASLTVSDPFVWVVVAGAVGWSGTGAAARNTSRADCLSASVGGTLPLPGCPKDGKTVPS